MVGAYVLAGEPARTDDHAAAFAIYGRIMRPFVEKGQGKGQGPGWTHPRTHFGITLQRMALNILSKPVLRDAFIKLGMHDPEDIGLPGNRLDRAASATRWTFDMARFL